ncbi:MAG: UDP-N-acetylenolpyruvoylglucosamine reductase [Candidatus Woesebacteria bacterium GW2011_GWA1_33_30]|uniref:UDP-N-acetylenolpyruvoylglucosamine reductase n=1 Tax=Candidatus Woesebacteria bacterium GW2011_GWA2_33_28 TaxID=1618561 RepID=A0A0F9ZQU7_9BACT|nr:MAG: UDP-N-acetylenolpyruvoylglucosamine reductase [Candidatus Woesebacteria bacterium GW2011_GWA2_33_28]KKP47539.1 MAG: UDP-N-acetylenolpyruvoylglucosamine reductase [Candidatus Woesebacteria bacterium GW2011_GWA1_33_30]KKP49151.1 MAG: UDP-N-acetylenolpyruvoylglucosamine reductase [Microgenomates group bacterium GW2011_GWC1_33_32]KKP51533.1 MAG: UDP-N-acetylenolpyruvoylglucosamine reductase [Candidatus Woesebacteria bacterium GW2011_GWB1_33_38]KKP57717.1 MAG: UDP-N-acetylenolpyruvoylglucosa
MGKTNSTSFKELTTLKVGGNIKYFREVSSKKEIVEVVNFAKKNNLSIFIIGGGSDIAVNDKNFDGLVIKYVGNKSQITNHKSHVLISVEAGIVWDDLVKLAVERNLQGIECLSGIPGSVGASPIQNIGAYGQELSETLDRLTAYDITNQKFIDFSNKDCKFGYRESIFKQKDYWQKFIIINITLKLKRYEDNDLSLQTIRDEILRVRGEKLVNPDDIPNAGSFFKNPIVYLSKKVELEEKYSDIKIYPFQGKYKVFAGFLIEKAGWKGKSLGPVKVSEKHALVLTNPGGKGTFSDIKNLADAIIKDVQDKFGIILEPEVQYINL